MNCPKCGSPVMAQYKQGEQNVAQCYNDHMWKTGEEAKPTKVSAAQRLKAINVEYYQRLQQLSDMIDEPSWAVLTASILTPKVLTASQKVEALDLWKKVKDLGMVKKLTQFIEHFRKLTEKIAEEAGIDLRQVVEAFQTKPMLAFFKAIKFSISVLMKPIKAFAELYKAGILKVFEEVHKTGVFQKLHSGAIKVDEFLDQYPIMRRLAGPAIAGLLLWMWTSANFTGSPSLDMDLTAVLKAALAGQWSAAELFTSPSGLAALGLLVTGLTLPFPSPLWLSAGLPINLFIALCYTAFKHLKGEESVARRLKSHMKFAHV